MVNRIRRLGPREIIFRPLRRFFAALLLSLLLAGSAWGISGHISSYAAPHRANLLPMPRVDVVRAVSIAARAAKKNPPLEPHGMYISGVRYGRWSTLSSGSCACASARTLVWAVIFTNPTVKPIPAPSGPGHASEKAPPCVWAETLIDAHTGEILSYECLKDAGYQG